MEVIENEAVRIAQGATRTRSRIAPKEQLS
jgi:hypothetical protein